MYAYLKTWLHVDYKIGIDLLLVCETMPPALHMHVFGIGIVKATLAELAIETDDLAVFGLVFFNVFLANWLDVFFISCLLLITFVIVFDFSVMTLIYRTQVSS